VSRGRSLGFAKRLREASGILARMASEESTAPDLVERWKRLVEAASSGDLDAVQSMCAPDAVWEALALGTRFEGAAAIRGFIEDWRGSYEEIETEPEEVTDLGHDVVFGVFLQKGRPVGTTGHIQFRFAQVATWADGLLVRTTGYQDIDEGRAAAERLAQERGETTSLPRSGSSR
jgi:ketosteroid isomerase-like protein